MPVTVENLQFVDLDKVSGLIHKSWGLNSEFKPTLELDEDYLEEIKGERENEHRRQETDGACR